ncbi:MAG: hypothetical protein R2882_12675 [Gemmatimonadales bacterium]
MATCPAGIALLAVLRALLERAGEAEGLRRIDSLTQHREIPVRTTRGATVGAIQADGELTFSAPAGG